MTNLEVASKQSGGKYSIGLALPLAEKLAEHLHHRLPGTQVQIVGSLRRGKALVSDVDILAGCPDGSKVAQALADFSGIDLHARETDRIAGYLPHRIPFEIILVQPREFACHLLTSTGSKAHRNRIMKGLETAPPTSFQNET
ncbi:MAG TPA: hypothetical protein DER60_10200, partial [Syntrophomonas sp.]|nr:hypothetical protein [Syntrophomonas sp.]